jgi:phosphoglycolate phosphatase-like HAD superfamily hydrolase
MIILDIKCIVWDLDGTLVDSYGVFGDILAEVVEIEGRAMPSQAERLRHYHGSLQETIQNVLGIKSAEELSKTLEIFLKLQEKYYEGDLGRHLYSDATKLACQASKKGITQVVVTNREHSGRGNASPLAIVKGTVLSDYIQDVVAGDDVEFRKPDKRSVVGLLESYNLMPENILVIGDQFVDAQLALNLGARAILVSRNGEIPHLNTIENHTATVTVLPDLENVIFSIA